jgi:hypothetical protein
MRRSRVEVGLICCLFTALCLAALAGCHSLSYIHGASEDQEGLWMAALKHFEGPVYYVGSDGDYSYFRAGEIFYTRYKAQTSKLSLPRTFQFGKGDPYLVTQDMVYIHQ